MARWAERGYVLANCILYLWSPDQDTEEPQLVIPASFRDVILQQYHNSPVGGHYVIERTLQKISSKYYFIGMRSFIIDHVKNCLECQRYKATNLKPLRLLQIPAPAQRFEVVAIDLFGPLLKTPRANKWILVIPITSSNRRCVR